MWVRACIIKAYMRLISWPVSLKGPLQVHRRMEGETERVGTMLAAHLATQGTGFGDDSDDDMLGF